MNALWKYALLLVQLLEAKQRDVKYDILSSTTTGALYGTAHDEKTMYSIPKTTLFVRGSGQRGYTRYTMDDSAREKEKIKNGERLFQTPCGRASGTS